MDQSKTKISCVPDIKTIPLCQQDQWLLIGCDGVWERVQNGEMVRMVEEFLLSNDPLSEYEDEMEQKRVKEREEKKGNEKKEDENNNMNDANNGDAENAGEGGSGEDSPNGGSGGKHNAEGSGSDKDEERIARRERVLRALGRVELTKVCEQVCDWNLAPEENSFGGLGLDNMSCMIIDPLSGFAPRAKIYAEARAKQKEVEKDLEKLKPAEDNPPVLGDIGENKIKSPKGEGKSPNNRKSRSRSRSPKRSSSPKRDGEGSDKSPVGAKSPGGGRSPTRSPGKSPTAGSPTRKSASSPKIGATSPKLGAKLSDASQGSQATQVAEGNAGNRRMSDMSLDSQGNFKPGTDANGETVPTPPSCMQNIPSLRPGELLQSFQDQTQA
jgi:hypothetical protein